MLLQWEMNPPPIAWEYSYSPKPRPQDFDEESGSSCVYEVRLNPDKSCVYRSGHELHFEWLPRGFLKPFCMLERDAATFRPNLCVKVRARQVPAQWCTP